ncbi:MAG: amino acid racemase [Pseudomonadota bacterium]
MKLIGLLGGTSWPSTIEYYRILNELTQDKLGGFHSANILLRSIDYHAIKSCYHDAWNKIPILLKHEIEAFVQLKPACLVICNNTLHKAFDVIEPDLGLTIPVFHSVKVTGRFAQSAHLNRLLLLGTKFTMEDGFYHQGLEAFGLQVSVPSEEDRSRIQIIQSQLAKGIIEPSFKQYFIQLINKHTEVDAVVLACTELPLVIHANDCKIPVINPTELQCKDAFEFALSE